MITEKKEAMKQDKENESELARKLNAYGIESNQQRFDKQEKHKSEAEEEEHKAKKHHHHHHHHQHKPK